MRLMPHMRFISFSKKIMLSVARSAVLIFFFDNIFGIVKSWVDRTVL